MEHQQKYLLVRFSDIFQKDCIAQHEKVLYEYGYCWYGKIGNAPSKKTLDAVFSEDHPTLVLFKKNEIYECAMKDYTLRKPEKAYPPYYDYEGIFPTISFCLTRISKAPNSLLHNSIVCSTGNYVDVAIRNSRIPMMLCEYIDTSRKAPI